MTTIDTTKPVNGHAGGQAAAGAATKLPLPFHIPAAEAPPVEVTAPPVVEVDTTAPTTVDATAPTVEPEEDDPFEPGQEPQGRSRTPLPQVIPGWLRTKADFTAVVREWAYRTSMLTLFHITRSPVYWLRCLWPATRTLGRAVRWLARFTFDAEGKTIRRELSNLPGAGRAEAATFAGVTNQHRNVVRERLAAVAVLLAVLAGAAVVAWLILPWPLLATVGVVVVPPLAWFSRDPARPVISQPNGRLAPPPPFDKTLITQALVALGNGRLTAGLKAEGLTLTAPICRDGAGYRADIDLPNVPASDVCEQRGRLAAGLRRPRACVWPSPDPDAHEARLILWVGDRVRSKAPQPWVLTKTGRVDLFKAFPVGTNPQGRPVRVCLMFASMIIGAVPRIGKTFCLRVLLLAASLDVRAELHTYDLKGADLRPLGMVSHRHRCGMSEETIEYLAQDMADVRQVMDRRYKVILSLPEKDCPEGKITPALAGKKSLGLHPIVIGIDETQVAFEHSSYGKSIEADVTDLARRGPAVGIILILSTQRPDAKSIPPAISSNAILRLAMWVKKWQVSDMILGDGMHSSGISGLMFTRSDRGTGWLAGEGDEPEVVTFGYVDAPTAKTIAQRARAARQAAGTLTGYAADLDMDATPDDSPTLLDDLATVFGPEETRVPGAELVTRLAAHKPDAYTGWTASTLGTAASALGLATVQCNQRVNGKVTNRKGLARDDIHAAITERDSRR